MNRPPHPQPNTPSSSRSAPQRAPNPQVAAGRPPAGTCRVLLGCRGASWTWKTLLAASAHDSTRLSPRSVWEKRGLSFMWGAGRKVWLFQGLAHSVRRPGGPFLWLYWHH